MPKRSHSSSKLSGCATNTKATFPITNISLDAVSRLVKHQPILIPNKLNRWKALKLEKFGEGNLTSHRLQPNFRIRLTTEFYLIKTALSTMIARAPTMEMVQEVHRHHRRHHQCYISNVMKLSAATVEIKLHQTLRTIQEVSIDALSFIILFRTI